MESVNLFLPEKHLLVKTDKEYYNEIAETKVYKAHCPLCNTVFAISTQPKIMECLCGKTLFITNEYAKYERLIPKKRNVLKPE